MAYKAKSITSKASKSCSDNMQRASPATLNPMIIKAGLSLISSMGKKEKKQDGGKTVVVVNNQKPERKINSEPKVGQAAYAIGAV